MGEYKYWTNEEVFEESRRFSGQRRVDFRNGSPRAYRVAIKRGLIDQMTWLNHRHFWTKEEVIEASRQYVGQGKIAFRVGNPPAWDAAYRNGWVESMPWLGEANHHYWTWSELVKASLPYAGKGRGAFVKGNEKAYRYARRMGWLDRLTWLGRKDSVYTAPVWSVYAYKFPNARYVGLTCDTTLRSWEHRTNNKGRSTVFKYHERTGLPMPEMTVLVHGLTKEQAQVAEDMVRKLYEKMPDVLVLNIAKTGKDSGSTGGVARRWSRAKIIELAKNCSSRAELKKKACAAYHKARKLGMLDELFPNKGVINQKRKPGGTNG